MCPRSGISIAAMIVVLVDGNVTTKEAAALVGTYFFYVLFMYTPLPTSLGPSPSYLPWSLPFLPLPFPCHPRLQSPRDTAPPTSLPPYFPTSLASLLSYFLQP